MAKMDGLVEVDHKHLEAHQQDYQEQLVNLRKQIEQLSSQLNDLQVVLLCFVVTSMVFMMLCVPFTFIS